ncbi:alpha-glucan family phosphorylase [Desulfatiglans anilini]|uniref:alpha-glucan family phosphorylase n=1 Tax=Desulfatiglans anilini TaxID=90728 RepID=UPI0004151955|nr:alpha-glucan family phosphorylase [Desulfatiglans anilini]
MRPKIKYQVVPRFPGRLESLRRLAYNLCFSWKDDIRGIFQRIDPALWRFCGENPVLMLGLVSQDRLEELARDQGFVAQLERVSGDFERYLSQPRVQAMDYSAEGPVQVAYFSAEFGLAVCLPIYSGGLGVLAGDHLKSASDLNLPLVAIGLLYQEGYFSQYLSSDGWQMETYPVNDFGNIPIKRVFDAENRPVNVKVHFKGQPVDVAVWRADVGRVPLYLLDTNLETNPPDVRQTTAQLYGGDREMRIRQEIVLGIGGVRALKALGIEPTVIHMNEGHSAFSALERINILRREHGLTFDAAREVVLASSVFTTHTPVPAGNDVFDPELVRAYFEEYTKELGLNFKVLLGYGRLDPRDNAEPFGMTTLALRLSAYSNGVSRLHGRVARQMWQRVWPHNPVEDIPIDHITNGIHVPTWISEEMGFLLDRYFGPNWPEERDNERVWSQVEQIPATELWRTHERSRERLVGFTRRRLAEQLKRRGASEAEVLRTAEILTPDALTIGFARRFATYKRATLLFRDPDRLARILNDPERPVQVIIAGKAHPQDNAGKEFIKRIIHLSRQERFRKRIVFLEDYNMHVAQHLVSGSDVWLNTPRRPLEACGTSGMKALANGSLNLSVLDGWWDEGYDRDSGWAIGHGEVYTDYEAQDDIESRDLYNLLEKEVIPIFYHRGDDGIPRAWVEKMRSGLRRLVPVFNAHRMVQDYLNRFYVPCSKRHTELIESDFAGAKDLAVWRQKLMTGWHEVAVEEVLSADGREMKVGDFIEVSARIRLGSLSPEDVTVEAYYGKLDHNGEFAERQTIPLDVAETQEDRYVYSGRIAADGTGRFGYTVRVTPSMNRLENRFVFGLVSWA